MVRQKLIMNVCAIFFVAFGVVYQVLLCFIPTLSNTGYLITSLIIFSGAFLSGYMRRNHLIITSEDSSIKSLNLLRWILRALCVLFFVILLLRYVIL